MGLFNKFFKPAESEYKRADDWVVSLDIGTEYIKCIVFEIQGNKGYVRGVGRERQTLGDMAAGAVINISGVIDNSKKAIREASG